MHILLTGGTGLMGRRLCARWRQAGHRLTVFSRRPQQVESLCGVGVRGIDRFDEYGDQPLDAVVNLAGEPIADKPWSHKRKALLWESRVRLTERLVEWLDAREQRPDLLLSGSAVGWYGDSGERPVTEEGAAAGEDFASELCLAWEQIAREAEKLGTRVVLLRTGLVLAPEGGFLGRLLPLYRLGLGGPLGDGRQWMPWIHLAATLAGRRLPFSMHRPGRGAGRCPGRPTKGSGMTENALLLLNLGSPDSTRVEDVRRYLDQFLMDPYVVDLPWPLRRLLVSLILIKRPAESAHAYSSIWWDEGSPLIVLSRRLQEAMKPHWPHGPVELAMRYGQPAIEKVLLDLARRGIRRVTLAPLYPQFADSTTTTAEQEVRRVIAAHRLGLEVSTLPPFYDQPVYLDALVESVRPYLQQPHDHLLLSFHGLPERHIRKLVKDPAHDLQAENSRNVSPEALALCYRSQCLRTAEAFAERAGLEQGRWSVSFQSRLGRAKWIEPYTDAKLDELVQRGVKRLLVMCPAFVADCIETLEEIGMRGREQFISAGGEDLVLIPCLNDHPAWVGALAEMSGRLARPL